ncbi:SRPBCC family protein [Rathayibacter sp. YIM 133350]|uniref:SRPBCC family protein n=1 Tax=Rathayibacter sp. YIM 133350 TaxID=3131992 RepID=UPI00307ECBF7
MAQVIESIDINVPVSTAYNQWTQFESFPRFLDYVDSVTQVGDTLTHWVVTIAGQTREFDAEITEQHPDERIAWNSVGGEENHAGVITFHKLSDDTSRLTVQLDWEPTGLLEKAGAAVGVDDHAIKKDLENFKELIEKRGVEEGAWRGDVKNDA